MAILSISISLLNPAPPQTLSSLESISGHNDVTFLRITRCPQLSLTQFPNAPFKTMPVRMGGGPRTFPGGVSKWQWKRMQAKKAKQLLKARLARERQIYEMRKRAELKAAVSELERPWEVVEKAPNLFSVTADEQVKVLADRFQKPGGFDMWSDRDGPELFKSGRGLPSARYFPKGVVHSTKPYGKVENSGGGSDPDGETVLSSKLRSLPSEGSKGNWLRNKARNPNTSIRRSNLDRANSAEFRFSREKNERSDPKEDGVRGGRRRNSVRKSDDLKAEVFDLTLQKDGRYELDEEKRM